MGAQTEGVKRLGLRRGGEALTIPITMGIWNYMKKTDRPPAPEAIERDPSKRLVVRWDDGTTTAASPRELRLGCGCAECVDEMTGARTLDPARIAPDVDIASMDQVGNYAIHFEFSDGHQTGIFAWSLLRRLSTPI